MKTTDLEDPAAHGHTGRWPQGQFQQHPAVEVAAPLKQTSPSAWTLSCLQTHHLTPEERGAPTGWLQSPRPTQGQMFECAPTCASDLQNSVRPNPKGTSEDERQSQKPLGDKNICS